MPLLVRYIALSLLLVALGLGSCRSTENPVCGDGVATGWEDCDGTDLRGMTCPDVVGNSPSHCTLYCYSDCTFNTTGCTCGELCGNGIAEFGESCDCGEYPEWLPTSCTDINGGPDANCDYNCNRVPYCGDGIVSGDEACDCGRDATFLGRDCSVINGAPEATCDASCLLIP